MTQDDIIAMAREAVSQITIQANGDVFYSFYKKELEAFAKLVAAHEREACAKVVEEPWMGHPKEIARAIRNRGQQWKLINRLTPKTKP